MKQLLSIIAAMFIIAFCSSSNAQTIDTLRNTSDHKVYRIHGDTTIVFSQQFRLDNTYNDGQPANATNSWYDTLYAPDTILGIRREIFYVGGGVGIGSFHTELSSNHSLYGDGIYSGMSVPMIMSLHGRFFFPTLWNSLFWGIGSTINVSVNSTEATSFSNFDCTQSSIVPLYGHNCNGSFGYGGDASIALEYALLYRFNDKTTFSLIASGFWGLCWNSNVLFYDENNNLLAEYDHSVDFIGGYNLSTELNIRLSNKIAIAPEIGYRFSTNRPDYIYFYTKNRGGFWGLLKITYYHDKEHIIKMYRKKNKKYVYDESKQSWKRSTLILYDSYLR